MRNRLIKKVAESYTYKFVSTWFVQVYATIYDDVRKEFSDVLSPTDALTSEDEESAISAFNAAWDSETINIIEKHITERTGANVKFSIELADKVYATVVSDEKLNNEQIIKIINELIGQYADGVGEGLEQHAFIEFNDGESSYFDDIYDTAFAFKDWCDKYGYNIPEYNTPEFYELYDKYENATIDITTHIGFYIKLWNPENFEVKLIK